MGLMDQLGGLLQKYAGAGAAQAPSTVHDDFDQLAQAAPDSEVADGLAAAFRSDRTPEFGQMVAQLFGQSSGTQRAGILNTLISVLGPNVIQNLLNRGETSGAAGNLDGQVSEVTPKQAERVPPEAVQQMAAQAEKHDPSIIDKISGFYAQHPTLIKTLGSVALTIALARIAESRNVR